MTRKGTGTLRLPRLRTPEDVLRVMEQAAGGALSGRIPTATVRLLTRIGAQSLRAIEMGRRAEALARRDAEKARSEADAAEQRKSGPGELSFEEALAQAHHRGRSCTPAGTRRG